MPECDREKEIAKARFLNGESIESIANLLKKSRRTIERWINDGNWRDLKSANKAVEPAKVVSLPKRLESRNEKPDERIRVPTRKQIEAMSDLDVIETAIADLYASLPNAEDKSKGGMAAALVRLIEFKQKLNPPTIEEFADQIIDRLDEWKLSPRDLAIALKQRQEGRKRA